MVILSLELFQKVESTVAQLFATGIAPVSKEQGYAGVNQEQVDGEWRQVLGITDALGTKRIVSLPVGRYLCVHLLAQTDDVRAFYQFRKTSLALVIEVGQL